MSAAREARRAEAPRALAGTGKLVPERPQAPSARCPAGPTLPI